VLVLIRVNFEEPEDIQLEQFISCCLGVDD
jgi:hypothetical protein